ncbi:hypothetical protein LL998_19230 [Burkholderia ambifaria]|uniref:hypothetical protein n=1 Tax=Burkholderia ambifaria TaxID=152480 RepID=UPI001E52EA60|nr:hypothetical protein [Burkholderia ambifaria]UEP38097.1 hypothetical protein LL998_19230 [Burkholderia ambifaria]
MKAVTAAAVATATVVSNISYAQPVPVPASDASATLPGGLRYVQPEGAPQMSPVLKSILNTAQQTDSSIENSVPPKVSEEVNQMISQPKIPVDLVNNLKVIFDGDLLLQDTFYTEANLKDIFNLEVASVIEKSDGAERDISISGSVSDSVFPRVKTSEFFGGSAAGARFGGGKTIHQSGAVTAALNFGMYKGGPDFNVAMKIFANKFVRLPSEPFPHGGPGAPTAPHGSETWRCHQVDGEYERTITVGFNSAGNLSNILIEVKKN